MNGSQYQSASAQQNTSATSQTLHPHYPSATSIPSRTASAPLPSPTAQRPHFISSYTTSSMASAGSATASPATSAFVAQASASSVQNAPQQYQYAQSHQNGDTSQQQPSYALSNGQQQGYGYAPDRSNAGSTAQETRAYIDNFALVAEAAKRAQMAVLTRDLEGMEWT